MNKTLGQKFYRILQHQKSSKTTFQPSLPLVSLNQLETQVNFFKKKKHEKQNMTQEITNNKEINVCSPFYDRMKTHKQNCKCPYHRKKRFSLLPVRHSHKSGGHLLNEGHRNSSHDKENISFRRDSKQPHFHATSSSQLNKSVQLNENFLSRTSPTKFSPKIQARNYSYEEFLKECEYHLIRKKGFLAGKPSHVVRKGAKQIFEFINKHLDYTVDKMSSWVNSIQKDKDYGQFYIHRFKEMKKNYQLKKRMAKTQLDQGIASIFARNNNSTSGKFRYTHSHTNLAKSKLSPMKKSKKQSQNSSDHQETEQKDSSQNNSSQNDSDDSQMSLQKIIKQLKLQSKISNQNSQDLMNMSIDSFKELFNRLQKNILNEKYTDDLLEKFDNGVLTELIKRYSNNPSIKDIQAKLSILTKVHDVLKRHRTRRMSNLSERNSYNMGSNSKGFTGSKRNTQNGQNSKTTNSLNAHSKKSSGNCSLQGSERNLYDIEDDEDENFYAIEEDQNELDEQFSSNQQKIIKSLANHGQNVRRSKLLKGDQFNFKDDHINNDSLTQNTTDRDYEIEKSHIGTTKGFFTKAEKYLFDINMGKTIVKKDDSIFTAKRKVRVLKMLLKQNPNGPQAAQLQNYIKKIELKVFQKTQKDNKLELQKKSSQNQGISEQELWKLISLDNLGYNLIFYNLSSKIKVEDNEDLCILLNEVKLNNARRFENKVTYKSNYLVEDIYERKHNKKKTYKEDTLMQEGMNNMEFQPEIESETQTDVKNMSKRTTKTSRKSLLELTALAKETKMSGFFGENTMDFDFDDMDIEEAQVQAYYQQLKKMFKYAKVHLPQTFEKYLKNSSGNLLNSQNSSFNTY